METSKVINTEFPGRTLSGIGGIETGNDAAQFILLGAHTVQVCTYVMKVGYRCIKPMLDELAAFMDRHQFNSIDEFRGHSLQYFTTHADLVRRQAEAREKAKSAAAARSVGQQVAGDGKPIKADHEWRGDDFVKQSDALARG